ncbi:hypothetical protein B4N84_22045 [Flavobacterium sp. IR1]|nr:hypothetical protein B4N84_22045 [Flavobacterium sp. IR1]
MKIFYQALVLLTICLASCKKETVQNEDPIVVSDTIKAKHVAVEQPLDSAAQIKAWINYATPGEAHQLMADETGNWNCDMTFWREPNGKPEKEKAEVTIKMILGNRYQESNFKGTISGQPFEGKGTLAFNNTSKEYTTTFIDNMGTGMMVANGKLDDRTKSIEFKGVIINPVDGKKTPYREIYTIVDPKTRKMEMFDVQNGEEYKSMEIILKKK